MHQCVCVNQGLRGHICRLLPCWVRFIGQHAHNGGQGAGDAYNSKVLRVRLQLPRRQSRHRLAAEVLGRCC